MPDEVGLLAHVDNIEPGEDPGVVWLATTRWIEGGALERDRTIADIDHNGIELGQYASRR